MSCWRVGQNYKQMHIDGGMTLNFSKRLIMLKSYGTFDQNLEAY